MSAGQWIGWLTVATVLIVAGVYRIRKYGRAEGGEVTPLNDLMDGPEQVGDDTLAMVAKDRSATGIWGLFAQADAHGIEVDDTAAEADMVNANGPAVLAEFAEDVVAWLAQLDSEAWLGERGWL
jgi:hypothetical protein